MKLLEWLWGPRNLSIGRGIFLLFYLGFLLTDEIKDKFIPKGGRKFRQRVWSFLMTKRWLPWKHLKPLSGPPIPGRRVSWMNQWFTVDNLLFFFFPSPSSFVFTPSHSSFQNYPSISLYISDFFQFHLSVVDLLRIRLCGFFMYGAFNIILWIMSLKS